MAPDEAGPPGDDDPIHDRVEAAGGSSGAPSGSS
jgi:hypothetical protein